MSEYTLNTVIALEPDTNDIAFMKGTTHWSEMMPHCVDCGDHYTHEVFEARLKETPFKVLAIGVA